MNPSQFNPPRWLRNPHLQSVLASSRLRRLADGATPQRLERRAVEHLLDTGGGVRLQGFHNAQHVVGTSRGLVVLLHGWEGSVRSSYLLRTAQRLLEAGFDVFRLNFRDHGDTHHLNEELFHSNRLDEVVGAVAAVAGRFPARPMAIAGYSLGGNFALRVALRAPAAGIPLSAAVAVCPVISPAQGLRAIETAPWFYEAYFLRKWRASLQRKAVLHPQRYGFAPNELRQSLRDLTRWLVERHTDFETLDRYLDGYSIAGDRLAGLAVPTRILTSADDPIIPIADFHALELPPLARLEIAPWGGHCGFLQDWRLGGFAERYITRRIEELMAGPAVTTALAADDSCAA